MDKNKEDKTQEKELIRILATDIPGNMDVYSGLTKINGVSWSLSNAVCKVMGIDKNKKISEFSEKEIEKISEFIENPKLPGFLLNRRKDLETGKDKHLVGSDLDLRKEFDVKRLKKIRSYRGLRHAKGLPVRGQRTRGNFRHKKTMGVQKTSKMKKAAGGSK